MACVLLIDDDEELTKALARYLSTSTRGHEVRVCNGGAEAVASPLEGVDVIVIDLSMPRVNGLDVIRALRERGETHPAILCSGVAGKQLRAEAFAAGFDAYVPKNSIEELAAAIETAALRRSGRSATPQQPNRHPSGGPPVDVVSAQESALASETRPVVRAFAPFLGSRFADRVAVVAGRELALTEIEAKIAACIVAARGGVACWAEIQDAVWGSATDARRRSLWAHLHNLRSKLRDAGDSFETISGLGVRFLAPPEFTCDLDGWRSAS